MEDLLCAAVEQNKLMEFKYEVIKNNETFA
jgi:hypothetical protein